MRLSRLVVMTALIQVSLDTAGIIVSLLWPLATGIIAFDELKNDKPIVYEDNSWVSGEVRTYHDYSRIRSSHPVIYMLPHLWTGVIPRMMDGYKCVVADQMVADHLDAWHSLLSSTGNNPWDHIILSLSKLHKQSPTKLERLQHSLDSALEMRRNNCRVRNPSLIIHELVFMGASLGICVVTIIVTLCKKMALMHLPWMVITGYEIAGNAAVSVTFLTSPGYPYLIVLICIIKMIVLKWVFVKVIRRHMIFCIEQREKKGIQQVKEDLERKVLRSQLSDKGKVRLARVFGNYSS